MHIALNPVPYFGIHFANRMRKVRPTSEQRKLLVLESSSAIYELAKSGFVSILQPLGSEIECLEGCVWITLDGDVRDVVIEPGQSFQPDRNRRALIHALESSRVRVAQIPSASVS